VATPPGADVCGPGTLKLGGPLAALERLAKRLQSPHVDEIERLAGARV
jgi:hypothetical protein